MFAATINIQPGTHHIRFLVDGQMQTSRDLPTTVDFGNNLVNYIEVNPDDAAARLAAAPSDGSTPKPEQMAVLSPSASHADEKKLPRDRAVRPAFEFKKQIPRYLIDFDGSEDGPAYPIAVAAIERLPNPPSLPGFLGKPILNAAVLKKDDNSVLNMPNHTVLNHLATSSIKNSTLAVSATTRYKSKVGSTSLLARPVYRLADYPSQYVTTIIYKPIGGDEKD